MKWVSIEDRLPDVECKVLVFSKTYGWEQSQFQRGKFRTDYNPHARIYETILNPTHWSIPQEPNVNKQ